MITEIKNLLKIKSNIEQQLLLKNKEKNIRIQQIQYIKRAIKNKAKLNKKLKKNQKKIQNGNK